MKKVLIFGVGGFVGSYISREFLDHGYEVYGSDKVKNSMLPKTVCFKNADLLNFSSVEELIAEVNPAIIINLAAVSSVGISWKIPQMTISVNVVGALNILEAAKKTNCKAKIMFVGSSEEYAKTDNVIDEGCELDANNPYGISKIAQEYFAKLYKKQYGMKIYYARSFNHTGVGQKDSFVLSSWCKQVAEIDKSGKAGKIQVGNLAVQRDFSHVKDIVRAYRMIVESDNSEKIYNIGSGKAHRLDKILQYIIHLSNQKITIEVDPSRIRPSDQPIICCDHSLITKELGWKPEYSVFDALKEMFNEYKK